MISNGENSTRSKGVRSTPWERRQELRNAQRQLSPRATRPWEVRGRVQDLGCVHAASVSAMSTGSTSMSKRVHSMTAHHRVACDL